MEDLKSDYTHQQIELERLRVSVEQAQYAQKEVQEKNSPHIAAPKRILPSLEDSIFVAPASLKGIQSCRTHLCFDFSRCSLTSGFPVYFYHPDDFGSWTANEQLIKSAITEALNINVHITFDPAIACIYVVLVGGISELKDGMTLEKYLQSLTHWNGDGRNHVLLNFALELNRTNMFEGINTGRSILVQSQFTASQFREKYDIIAPPLMLNNEQTSQNFLYSPARRKFLLSYQGEYRTQYPLFKTSRKLSALIPTFNDDSDAFDKDVSKTAQVKQEADSVEEYIVNTLKEMQNSPLGDNFFFQFSCAGSAHAGLDSEWLLCGTSESRISILRDSTFALIISPADYNLISTPQIHIRLHEALRTGAVPVILGNHIQLPFNEFIDWMRAVIFLPKARISELHYYLRTFADRDILLLRHQGKFSLELC